MTCPTPAGFTSLTLQTTNPQGWPHFFGVVVKANTTTLAISMYPWSTTRPAARPGSTSRSPSRASPNLSLNSAAANYAVTAINAASRLIQVAAGSSTPPSGFPAAPTMLLEHRACEPAGSQRSARDLPDGPSQWPDRLAASFFGAIRRLPTASPSISSCSFL